MFLPERYRRQPWRRPSSCEISKHLDPDAPEPSDAIEPDTEPLDLDEPEDVELSDADFLHELRTDVDGVKDGTVPAFSPKPVLKDRPWSKKRRPRDRYGNRIY